MIGYAPFLGEVRLARHTLGQALRCWKTDNGGAVCTNLLYYSPDCPTTPPITETKIAPTPPEASGAS
jgi:hypothetical protein